MCFNNDGSMRSKRIMGLLVGGLLLFFVISCSPFAPKVRTAPAGELPETFALYVPGPEKPDQWWEAFNAPQLNALIEEALSGSFTLREAWARLSQARALAVKAGADLYPGLEITSGASSSRMRSEKSVGGRSTSSSESYSLGLAAGYELDLWGRIRSEQEAAILDATATREDLNAAAMTLAAGVTEAWIGIIAKQMERDILDRQLDINRTYLELVELRFRKAMASALDVYQQRQIVEKVKAEVPLVEKEEQLLRHRLALLLGKLPRTELAITARMLPEPAPIPDTGLPVELLAARPDVRAAGLRLRAADWQVAAARANRLPRINLSASSQYASSAIDALFHNWIVSLAASLTAPLLDGNRRKAEVDRTVAVVEEHVSVYQRTVYTAIKEVEDALVSEEKELRHIEALNAEMESAQRALTEAREQYLKGLKDYLPVLTQLLKVQELEITLLKRKQNLLTNRISLYRALGGTWTERLRDRAGIDRDSIVAVDNTHTGER